MRAVTLVLLIQSQFMSDNLRTSLVTQALSPQMQSFSEFDNVQQDSEKGDEELLELSSQIGAEMGVSVQSQAQVQAKEQLMQRLELSTQTKQKTILDLQREYIQSSNEAHKMDQKHMKLLAQRKSKRQQQQKKETLSLSQVSSNQDSQEVPEEKVQEVILPAVKQTASIKAPDDKQKLKLVQINNQAPPKKKIAGPRHMTMLQIDADIQIDMGERSIQKEFQNAKEQAQTTSKTELNLEQIQQKTSEAVESALKDKADGAEDRAEEKAYIWTKLDTSSYENMASKEDNSMLQSEDQITIAQGMAKTGGYEGTDLDQQEDVNIHTLSQLGADTVEYMKLLKTKRRQLREKILCAENCEFEKWTFLTGITLNKNCPVDCPVEELIGQFKHKSSRSALEAYNSFFEIRDLSKNKNDLEQLDLKINEQQQQFGQILAKQEQDDEIKELQAKNLAAKNIKKQKHQLIMDQEGLDEENESDEEEEYEKEQHLRKHHLASKQKSHSKKLSKKALKRSKSKKAQRKQQRIEESEEDESDEEESNEDQDE